MDSEQLVTALNAVIHRLVVLAAEDAQLRTELRALAEAVLEITGIPDKQAAAEAVVQEPPAVEVAGESVPPTVEPVAEATALQEAEPFVPLAEVLQKLTLGQPRPAVEPAPVSYPAHWLKTTTADLSVIEARCRLKAEGARWAATRRRLIMKHASFSTEIDPRDRAIISKAKTVPDCFLWMCHPSGPSPSDPNRFEDVAGCFDAVADILSVVKQIQDAPDLDRAEFEHSLDLLAEAQSVLRASIDIIHGPTDTDQTQVFNWLKATASERQIFIQRFMRIDDPAESWKRTGPSPLAGRPPASSCSVRGLMW